MNNPDQDLNQILQALGQTQPPRRLNQRILANLEARATTTRPSHNPLRFLTALAPSRPLIWTAATALIAVATILTLNHVASLSHNPASRYPEVSTSGLSSTTTDRALAPGVRPDQPQNSSLATKGIGHVRTPGLAWGFSPTNRDKEMEGASAPGLSLAGSQQPPPENTTASSDPAYAPSFPAPPAPLTREEKLLRRMVRHDNPVLLAELDLHAPHPNLAPQRSNSDAFFSAFIPSSAPPSEPPIPSTDAAPDPAAQPAAISAPDTTTTGDQQ